MDKTRQVKWRDIPITRLDKNTYENGKPVNSQIQYNSIPAETQKQSGKKVTWNENLLDIKNISPRITQDKFKFPSKTNSTAPDYCSQFTCRVGHPCRLISIPTAHTSTHSHIKPTTSQLKCSPQLQKVVFRAVKHLPHQEENTKYEWNQQNNNLNGNCHQGKNYLSGTFV